jgi:hypothetical protein
MPHVALQSFEMQEKIWKSNEVHVARNVQKQNERKATHLDHLDER